MKLINWVIFFSMLLRQNWVDFFFWKKIVWEVSCDTCGKMNDHSYKIKLYIYIMLSCPYSLIMSEVSIRSGLQNA